MVEDLDLDTYLCISSNELKIYLFNKKNLNNLYFDKIIFNTQKNFIDFNILDKFLEENIFKIEKLSKKFIKRIFLIVENIEITQVNFGIKKKNYESNISEKLLRNILTEAKDLFRENYQNHQIMHILISRYYENGNYHSSLGDEFSGDYLCVEFQFKYISKNLVSEINKILNKYHVELGGCLDGNYIKNYFSSEQLKYSEMIYKILCGFNENEVKLVSKNFEKKGFFEKFFQLFS
tara:strand:+ start:457 stop:1161 length:705 start_codon:yes stop_codon:yes gene_type:complete